MLVPHRHDLLVQGRVEVEAVSIGEDDALKGLRVDLGLDHRVRVPHEVVVQFKAAWLLLVNNDLADLEEEVVHLRVVVVELGAAVGRS